MTTIFCTVFYKPSHWKQYFFGRSILSSIFFTTTWILRTILLSTVYWRQYCGKIQKNCLILSILMHFRLNNFYFHRKIVNNLLLTNNCLQYNQKLSTIISSSIIVNDNCKQNDFEKFNQYFGNFFFQKNWMNDFRYFRKKYDYRRNDSRPPLYFIDFQWNIKCLLLKFFRCVSPYLNLKTSSSRDKTLTYVKSMFLIKVAGF